jgi:hypothetical protein
MLPCFTYLSFTYLRFILRKSVISGKVWATPVCGKPFLLYDAHSGFDAASPVRTG